MPNAQSLFINATQPLQRFQSGAQAQANSLVNSPLVKQGQAAQQAISQNVAKPIFNGVQRSVNPIVNTALSPGTTLLKPALQHFGIPAGIAAVAGAVGDFASPGGAEARAPSVLSYITKAGQKVFTHITPQEYTHLFDEVKNIPQNLKGVSQIHLDPYNSRLKEVAQYVPRDKFIAGHPQAQETFKNANPISIPAHARSNAPAGVPAHFRRRSQ